jgi:hypothetical protein
LPRLLIALVCASLAFAADAPLALQVVAEATPPGATVQVKVYVAAPLRITSGALAMDLDPKVFGSIDRVAAYSATGDAAGWADVRDRHVEAHFQSTSGSIGQLPGVPVFVLSVPVLAEAQPEASATVTDPVRSLVEGDQKLRLPSHGIDSEVGAQPQGRDPQLASRQRAPWQPPPSFAGPSGI